MEQTLTSVPPQEEESNFEVASPRDNSTAARVNIYFATIFMKVVWNAYLQIISFKNGLDWSEVHAVPVSVKFNFDAVYRPYIN